LAPTKAEECAALGTEHPAVSATLGAEPEGILIDGNKNYNKR